MGYSILVASQKGGVGKSTLCRMIAREAALDGMDCKIADLDIQQGTSFKWAQRRAKNNLKPVIRVETFADVHTAIAEAETFDLYIYDGAPHSSRETRIVAQTSDLIVIPTGQSLDDLEPAVLVAHDLYQDGIPRECLAFALCRVSDSEREVKGARDYLAATPYQTLAGEIPNRTGFSQALDLGKAITETQYRSLTKKADKLAQSIIDAVVTASERRAS